MKKKALALILTAGMITSGFTANTFASDSAEDFVQFSEEAEATDEIADASIDSNLSFEDDEDTETTEIEESEDSFSDTEDFAADTEISTVDSSGDTQEPDQEATPAPTVESSPTLTPSVSPAPTPIPAFSLTYKSESLKWEDHTTISLSYSTNRDCKWYSFYVDAGTSEDTLLSMYDSSLATNPAKANTEFTVTAENVPEKDSWLIICVKPTSGRAKMKIHKLDNDDIKGKRPRSCINYKVTQGTVKGLEKPLKFLPGKFYNFTVTGAGMNNTSPVSGDTRWVPVYWSTSANPSSAQKNTTWRIGSTQGIRVSQTFNMYIFFKKQVYNGKSKAWKDSDVIQSITTHFTSVAFTNTTIKTKAITGLKTKYTVSKGKTVTLKPVLSPVTSTEKITYSSSNKNIASVSSKGVIKGIKAGTAKITVKSGSKKVVLTVTVPRVATKKISGIKSAITLRKGQTSQLKPKLTPSNSDDKISYGSSNSKVVTVNSKGVLTAKKKGTAIVTIKSGKVKISMKVTVK